MINVVRASVRKKQDLLLVGFLNSLCYAFPFGMLLTACNFLFESVRKYYFDWWIVVLPTLAVWIIGIVYEMFQVYQVSRRLTERKSVFVSKPVGYVISQSNLVTN
jgi:type II secretory pathway component PulL